MTITKQDFEDVIRGLNVELQLIGAPEVSLQGTAGMKLRSVLFNWIKNGRALQASRYAQEKVVDDAMIDAESFMKELAEDAQGPNKITGFIPLRQLLNMYGTPEHSDRVKSMYKEHYRTLKQSLELSGWTNPKYPVRLGHCSYRGFLKLQGSHAINKIWVYNYKGWHSVSPEHYNDMNKR